MSTTAPEPVETPFTLSMTFNVAATDSPELRDALAALLDVMAVQAEDGLWSGGSPDAATDNNEHVADINGYPWITAVTPVGGWFNGKTVRSTREVTMAARDSFKDLVTWTRTFIEFTDGTDVNFDSGNDERYDEFEVAGWNERDEPVPADTDD